MSSEVNDVLAALKQATKETYEAAVQTIPVKSEQAIIASMPKQ